MAPKDNERNERKVWKSNMFFFSLWLFETSFFHVFQAGLEPTTWPKLASDNNPPAPAFQVLDDTHHHTQNSYIFP